MYYIFIYGVLTSGQMKVAREPYRRENVVGQVREGGQTADRRGGDSEAYRRKSGVGQVR